MHKIDTFAFKSLMKSTSTLCEKCFLGNQRMPRVLMSCELCAISAMECRHHKDSCRSGCYSFEQTRTIPMVLRHGETSGSQWECCHKFCNPAFRWWSNTNHIRIFC